MTSEVAVDTGAVARARRQFANGFGDVGAGASPRRWSRPEVVTIGLLTAAVLAAGTWRLGALSLTNDEAATWAISGHTFSDLVHVLRFSGGDRGAGLYYAFEHLWIAVFGAGEVALRAPSVIAAAATISPLYGVARRVVERRAAVTAVVLFASSPFFLGYARVARTYSLATFLVVCGALAFVRAVESATRRDWLIYVALATVSVYVHWFGVLVVLAEYVALVSLPPERVPWRRVRQSAVLFVALTSPISLAVLFGNTTGVSWIAPLNIGELQTLASNFTGTTSTAGQLLFLAVLGVGLVEAIGMSRRNRRAGSSSPTALLATWFVVPFVVMVALSVLEPVLIARYLEVALPGFALLLGVGLTRIAHGNRLGLVAGVLLLAIVGAHGYQHIWTQPPRENWREIALVIDREASPTDAIVLFPATTSYAFAYYARDEAQLRLRIGPTWPPTSWEAPFDRTAGNASALTTVKRLHSDVTWLVVRDPGGPTVSQDAVGHRVRVALERALHRRYATTTAIEPFAKGAVTVTRYLGPRQP